MEPFDYATKLLSGSRYPTIETVIPIYDKLITLFEIKEKDRSLIIRKAATAGKEKLAKYYDMTTNYHDIATVLDPRLKLVFFQKEKYLNTYIKSVKERSVPKSIKRSNFLIIFLKVN